MLKRRLQETESVLCFGGFGTKTLKGEGKEDCGLWRKGISQNNHHRGALSKFMECATFVLITVPRKFHCVSPFALHQLALDRPWCGLHHVCTAVRSCFVPASYHPFCDACANDLLPRVHGSCHRPGYNPLLNQAALQLNTWTLGLLILYRELWRCLISSVKLVMTQRRSTMRNTMAATCNPTEEDYAYQNDRGT